jgi:hypothetical protein
LILIEWYHGANIDDQETPMHPIIKMALRRAKPGTGSSREFLDRRTALQPIPDLEAILGVIPWALVGGIAIRAYMPERTTLDVDIMIQAQDEWPARQAFAAAGYVITGDLSIGGFTVRDENDKDAPPIDVLASQAPWLKEALAHPGYDTAGYAVMPRPYLMLLKMEAGRGQDLIDVQRMLRDTPSSERSSTRMLIARHAPEMVEDYDALIQLADIEFGQPDGS